MQRAYCRWYEKELENVTEQEQYQCDENGQDCADCPDRAFKDITED